MKYYPSYLLLLLLLGLSFSLSAQTKGEARRVAPGAPNMELERKNAKSISTTPRVLPVHRAYLYLEALGNVELDPEKLAGPNSDALLAKQPMNYKLILQVFNPGSIAKIHVTLGSAEGKSNFVSQTFRFDQPATTPYSYTRDGKTIVLGLGEYTNLGSCYGEVVLEDLNGKRSAPKRFSSKG